jgi:hypothetical protein
LNSLLHLPKIELPAVLRGINSKLTSGGLFYLGVYGGKDHEGVWEEDHYVPKRFFSFYLDEDLKKNLIEVFDIHSFRKIETNRKKILNSIFSLLYLEKGTPLCKATRCPIPIAPDW